MASKHPQNISKSKFLAGKRCHKLFWYHVHDPKKIPPPNPRQQAMFQQGHAIGKMARALYPDGIKIPANTNFERLHQKTIEATQQRKPIFEGGLLAERACAIADLLIPAEEDQWDLIEVKSSAGVKEENLWDVAFQCNTFEKAGLSIRNCFVQHLDKNYVRHGDIELGKLLIKTNVTEEIRKLIPEVEGHLTGLIPILSQKETPKVAIGEFCSSPYTCPFFDACWEFLPEHSVFTLIHGKEKAWELFDAGIQSLVDLPSDFPLTEIQAIQAQCIRTGSENFDVNTLCAFLDKLVYPLYFLDLEAFQTAVPLYDGLRPFEQVPFQFSLHVMAKPGEAPQHHSFLARGIDNPRREVFSRLQKLLSDRGSIIAYNASFEIQRFEEVAANFPEFEGWVQALIPRFVDLYEPFRNLDYYHPNQNGSTSIKKVLPAITGTNGYEGMEISNGNMASIKYMRATFGTTSSYYRFRVRQELERYCTMDTLGMVQIIKALQQKLAACQKESDGNHDLPKVQS